MSKSFVELLNSSSISSTWTWQSQSANEVSIYFRSFIHSRMSFSTFFFRIWQRIPPKYFFPCSFCLWSLSILFIALINKCSALKKWDKIPVNNRILKTFLFSFVFWWNAKVWKPKQILSLHFHATDEHVTNKYINRKNWSDYRKSYN